MTYYSVNRKARPVVEGGHNKSWNDHGFSFNIPNIKNDTSSFSLRNIKILANIQNKLVQTDLIMGGF